MVKPLKQFFGNSWRIAWVYLTILWGWRLGLMAKSFIDSVQGPKYASEFEVSGQRHIENPTMECFAKIVNDF